MANHFPRWTNLLPLQIAICLGAVGIGVAAAITYYATPKATRVGYQPSQPIPYDHALHVEQLGLDCRYCHSFVEHSGHANIPSANTCWNCHDHVKKGSPKLSALRSAMGVEYVPEANAHQKLEGEAGKGHAIEWVRVYKAPDYVYFDHSAHVNRGISCQSCHGKVNEMEVVHHAETHSMSWCLDCHRAPEKHLRPLEEIYNMNYDPVDYLAKNEVKDAEGKEITTPEELGKFLVQHWGISPKESCSTCHR